MGPGNNLKKGEAPMPGTGVKHWSLGPQINKDAGNAKQTSLKLVEGYSTNSLAFCFS